MWAQWWLPTLPDRLPLGPGKGLLSTPLSELQNLDACAKDWGGPRHSSWCSDTLSFPFPLPPERHQGRDVSQASRRREPFAETAVLTRVRRVDPSLPMRATTHFCSVPKAWELQTVGVLVVDLGKAGRTSGWRLHRMVHL